MYTSFAEKIKKIYEQETYLDKYGDSLVIAFVIIFIFFLLFSYLFIRNQVKSLKVNWNENKCKPYVIPFAGFINGKHGEDSFDFTEANFTECTQSILTYIAGEFIKPIYYSLNVLHSTLSSLEKGIQNARKMFNYITTMLSSIFTIILDRIFNTLIPLQHSFIKQKSIFGKIQGILTATLFTAFGSFLSLKSFFASFSNILITALIALSAFTISMWIIPFTWPVAAGATAFFVAVSIPLAIILSGLERVIYLTEKSIPSKPSCFDENTLFTTKNHGQVKIKDLEPGTILGDGTKVTAVMKCDASGQKMFFLNNVYVTGSHSLFYNNKIICISEHPDAIELDNYKNPFVYCLSTNTKKIILDDITFLDWDDLTKEETEILRNNNVKNIESCYGGFPGKSVVTLEDGSVKYIENIKVGDSLDKDNVVYGIVKLPPSTLYMYSIFNKRLVCSNHLFISQDNLARSISNYARESLNIKKPLYNLLTTKGIFSINSIKCYDFNGNIEVFLDN